MTRRIQNHKSECVLLGFTSAATPCACRYNWPVHPAEWTPPPEPCAWEARIVAELAQLPPGRGAFTDDYAVYKSAQSIDHFLHLVDAERTQGLAMIDPYTHDARRRPISKSKGDYYVEHPEELAQIGQLLSPAVHSNGVQVWPLSASEVVLVDDNYNRIVKLAPGS